MLRLLTLLTILMLLAHPVAAKQNKKSTKATKDTATAELVAEGQFSAAEKHIIRNEILQGQSPLPQGLEKRQESGKRLPPGWQKKITRGKRLDFHVYRSSAPLPGKALDRLPPAQAGTELIRIENEILRLEVGTRIVLDRFPLLRK